MGFLGGTSTGQWRTIGQSEVMGERVAVLVHDGFLLKQAEMVNGVEMVLTADKALFF